MSGAVVPDTKNLKLIEKVGDGGMATVWKAWDESNGRYVA